MTISMKIVCIHNVWGQEARGGAEQVLRTIISQLQQFGHRVVVITTGREKGITVEQTSDGLTIYSVYSPYHEFSQWSIIKRLWWHIRATIGAGSVKTIKKILEKEQPDIVWTHNLVGLGQALLGISHFGSWKHLHTLHDIQLLHPSGLMYYGQEGIVNTPWARIYQYLVRRRISSETTIISPSQWLLELHQHQGIFVHQPTLVLSNPTPIVVEERGDQARTTTSTVLTFLYVGQIEKHKGIQMLVEAFQKVAQADWQLEIVGGGSLLAKLQADVSDTQITFLGPQPAVVVKERMEQAYCLVVPSLCYENFPTVILEAMSLQTPVIGSDCGGITELLATPELLFKPQANEVEKKILWCAEHPEELRAISRQRFAAVKKVSAAEYCRTLGLGEVTS